MATTNQNLQKNAKITPVKRHRKGRIVAILIIILAVGIAGTVLALNLINANKSSNQAEEPQATSVDQTDMTSGKSSEATAALGSSNEASNKTPSQYEGDNPNNYSNLTGIVTFTGVSEGQFVVSVALDQFITGSCHFTIEGPAGSVINTDIDIFAGPSSSFCSYNGPVPADHGIYKITVTPTSADKTGTITGEVEL